MDFTAGCQPADYEGHLEHLRPELPAIESAYAEPLPTLTVSPHLAELLALRDVGPEEPSRCYRRVSMCTPRRSSLSQFVFWRSCTSR